LLYRLWITWLVSVIKKNGKVRPCVDYRCIHVVTIKDAFPLPRIQDCLDTVAGAILFSTFDLTSGYHQIPVRSVDIHKTAFVTKYGLFEFQTMPFGVCSGPPTCQRLMELVLNVLQWKICLIYLGGRRHSKVFCNIVWVELYTLIGYQVS
jgi:hypothetical protein